MSRNNIISKCFVWHEDKYFLNKPIIDQPLPFFDTITPLPPPTFFQYPRIVIVEQLRDYLRFKVITKT